MADRFPLIVDTTGTAAIKELASGDNLDLTGSGVVGAGTVALTNLTVGGSQGSDGQVLTSNGSGIAWENAGQTAAETRTLVDSATDSNVFTDADHSKLDGIEVSADVTDTANVVGALTAGTNVTIASNGTISSTDTNTTYTVGDGGLTQNNFTDTLKSKLDGVEASADVTDAANVTSAGALMDSELTSIASVKAMNQGVATTDSPTFAGVTTSGITNTANLKISGAQGADGQILTSTGSGVAWEDAAGGGGGAWTVISSTTVSSSVASVELTLTGYDLYAIAFYNITYASTSSYDFNKWDFSIDGGSNYLSSGIYQAETRAASWSNSNSSSGRSNVAYVEIGEIYGSGQNHDGIIYFLNNKSGPAYKVGYYEAAMYSSSGVMQENGAFQATTTSAINKVRYRPHGNSNGNINGGRFVVYGLSTS